MRVITAEGPRLYPCPEACWRTDSSSTCTVHAELGIAKATILGLIRSERGEDYARRPRTIGRAMTPSARDLHLPAQPHFRALPVQACHGRIVAEDLSKSSTGKHEHHNNPVKAAAIPPYLPYGKAVHRMTSRRVLYKRGRRADVGLPEPPNPAPAPPPSNATRADITHGVRRLSAADSGVASTDDLLAATAYTHTLEVRKWSTDRHFNSLRSRRSTAPALRDLGHPPFRA